MTETQEYAPEWSHHYGLTWSGKWHIIDVHQSRAPAQGFHAKERRALCGAYVYTREHLPRYVARLQAVSSGLKQAPKCKKCERSVAA